MIIDNAQGDFLVASSVLGIDIKGLKFQCIFVNFRLVWNMGKKDDEHLANDDVWLEWEATNLKVRYALYLTCKGKQLASQCRYSLLNNTVEEISSLALW
jgi:hypothetical protein